MLDVGIVCEDNESANTIRALMGSCTGKNRLAYADKKTNTYNTLHKRSTRDAAGRGPVGMLDVGIAYKDNPEREDNQSS